MRYITNKEARYTLKELQSYKDLLLPGYNVYNLSVSFWKLSRISLNISLEGSVFRYRIKH